MLGWSVAIVAMSSTSRMRIPYFHIVFTLPAQIGVIAYHNKAEVYGLLFTAAAETLTTIAADPKHLGANIGLTAVLLTWGQSLDHHPHVHRIVPGGGVSPDGVSWVRCRSDFFLPVRVLSRLFRRLFLEGLVAAYDAGELQFFADLVALRNREAFKAYLAPLRTREWVVYAKRPFAGPKQVLAYLARYTHRVAIANSRLLHLSDEHVSFRWKDYRENGDHKNEIPMNSPLASPAAVSCWASFPMASVLLGSLWSVREWASCGQGHAVSNTARCIPYSQQ